MASFFGMGGGNPTIDINIDGLENKKHVLMKGKNIEPYRLPLYVGDDDVSGTVSIKLGKNKKFEHTGIRIELIGHVEILIDK